MADPDSGVIQIKVYSPQGIVQFSDRADVVGTLAGDDEELAEALRDGEAATAIQDANDDAEVATVLRADMHLEQVLEEYIPIMVDGHVGAVFEVYRDAAPILAPGDRGPRPGRGADRHRAGGPLRSSSTSSSARPTDDSGARRSPSWRPTRRDALTGLLNHGAIVVELARQLDDGPRPRGRRGHRARRRRQLPAAQRHARPPGG